MSRCTFAHAAVSSRGVLPHTISLKKGVLSHTIPFIASSARCDHLFLRDIFRVILHTGCTFAHTVSLEGVYFSTFLVTWKGVLPHTLFPTFAPQFSGRFFRLNFLFFRFSFLFKVTLFNYLLRSDHLMRSPTQQNHDFTYVHECIVPISSSYLDVS